MSHRAAVLALSSPGGQICGPWSMLQPPKQAFPILCIINYINMSLEFSLNALSKSLLVSLKLPFNLATFPLLQYIHRPQSDEHIDSYIISTENLSFKH